jgi:protoporphyrin/coproporphyrin ferrochelatase
VRGGRPVSPEMLAEIRHRYAQIGGRSPLLDLTRAQAKALQERLNGFANGQQHSYGVFVGMRHWKPYIHESLQEIMGAGFEKVIAICMAPHASKMSSGAYLEKLRKAEEALQPGFPVEFVESWYDQPQFIEGLAEKVAQATLKFPLGTRKEIRYLFTAHSLPASIIEQGDPYADQLQATARLLADRLHLAPDQWLFCYQSAGAMPGRWLGPDIVEMLTRLSAAGVKQVLVTPVGFLADHVEVLFDLDIEAQASAQKLGIHLERSESLNSSPLLIEALVQIVSQRT